MLGVIFFSQFSIFSKQFYENNIWYYLKYIVFLSLYFKRYFNCDHFLLSYEA